MIRLEVQRYCSDCHDFEPDVTKPERLYRDDHLNLCQTDTIVQCRYAKRCEAIKRYLERKTKGDN